MSGRFEDDPKVKHDIEILNSHIDATFKRVSHHQYRIHVARIPFDHCVNFFMDVINRPHRPKSIPLHTIYTDDEEYFDAVIAGIRHHTQLTLDFYGFAGSGWRWTKSGKLVERWEKKIESHADSPF